MVYRRLDYANKVILAPMVRINTLPTRLLALEMGADIVYTEELIDYKLLKCRRHVNDVLGTIDYINPMDGNVVFRTCKKEKDFLVLQLGTSCAKRALAVGKLVENDVSGLDINMGCPKEFSIKGGMGAALLANPDKAIEILKTLVNNLNIGITCKIRLLDNLDATIDLVKKLANTGISAIAIHARTRHERPQNPPHADFIREIVKHVSIPIIANGGGSKDMQTYDDILTFRKLCETSSVMIARPAQLNVSIFRKEGPLPINEIIQKYLQLCVDYDNVAHNTKYVIQCILKDLNETILGKQFQASQTVQQMCELWGLGNYCRLKIQEFYRKGLQFNCRQQDVQPPNEIHDNANTSLQEPLMENCLSDTIIEENINYLRSNYCSAANPFPKTSLFEYARKNGRKAASFETENREKLFRSTCNFNGKRYRSKQWQKNKRQAEQAAALVALKQLGLVTVDELIKNGSMLK